MHRVGQPEIARAPAARDDPAAQDAAAAVEHGRAHVREGAITVGAGQQVPGAELREDVLHDVLGRRPVAQHQRRQPDQFRLPLPEQPREADGIARGQIARGSDAAGLRDASASAET